MKTHKNGLVINARDDDYRLLDLALVIFITNQTNGKENAN
jgi:hypothetical protein